MISKTCGAGPKQMFVEFLVMECKGEALEFSIFMYAQTGDNQVVLLKPPAKVLDMHEQEIKLGYDIMLREVGLKNFGDNNIK